MVTSIDKVKPSNRQEEIKILTENLETIIAVLDGMQDGQSKVSTLVLASIIGSLEDSTARLKLHNLQFDL